jgi:glutamyl/glutaminyl-tRNA synthetase
LRPFFEDPVGYDADAIKKHLSLAGVEEHVAALREAYATTAWTEADLERTLRELADARTVKAGLLIQAARIAATGGMISPGLFEMLVLLGRETVLRRLERLVGAL